MTVIHTKVPVINLFLALIILLITVIVPSGRVPASDFPAIDLSSIDGVVHVEAVAGNTSEWMPQKYILTFLQQLDWSDPSAGFFPQRVEIGLHPGASVTVMETAGYNLSERLMTRNDQPEVCSILGANYVKIEHRFNGASYPEGMTNAGTYGWEYATAENEAGDYHRIFQSLSKALGGNWICFGISRGGRACLDYARLYPEDAVKGYVAYVGVNCSSDRDPRMVQFLTSEVGNSAYTEEAGAQMRSIMKDFQIELMRNKPTLSYWLWGSMTDAGLVFADGMTESRMYDISVYEFPIGFWISEGDIEELKWILQLPEETEEEVQIKLGAEYNLLTRYGSSATFSWSSSVWPFYAGCLKWEGMYDYDFSYLRNALQDAGLSDRLAVTQEEQQDYLRKLILSDQQQEVFRFTPGHFEALDGWAKQTSQNVLFIGGDLDPWSSVYIDGGSNPNFRTYICKGKSHHVQISHFDPEVQSEIILTLYTWLQ